MSPCSDDAILGGAGNSGTYDDLGTALTVSDIQGCQWTFIVGMEESRRDVSFSQAVYPVSKFFCEFETVVIN